MALSIEGGLGSTPERRLSVEALRRPIHALEEQLSPPKGEEKQLICELYELVLERAPISNISDDILREIFLQTLPSAREQALSTYPKPFRIWESPLLLRRVCKKWKDLTESYSLLWTTLRVYIPENAPSGRDMVMHWAAAWQRLTKASNIELHLITHVSTAGLFSSALPPPSYERITKLSLSGQSVDFLPIASLTPPERGFPVLEELVMAYRDDLNTVVWKERGPLKAFANCPRLRRVAIRSVSSGAYFPTIVLPWQQLTHLIILSPTPLRFYTMSLKDCHSLRFAYILPMNDPLDQSNQLQACQWRWDSLTNLTLNFWESQYHIPFFPPHFNHLQFDTLQSLRLIGMEFEILPIEDIDRFFRAIRSMKSLQHLSLCFSAIDSVDYADIFQCLPQLTNLDVQLRNLWDEDVLQILNYDPSLLPNLKTISIDIGPGWARDFSVGRLVTLIEACARKTFQRVDVYIPVDLESVKGAFSLNLDDFNSLKNNRAGVEVEIHDVHRERLDLDDWAYWIDREPELVRNWPEARNAFVIPEGDPDFYLYSDSDDSGED